LPILKSNVPALPQDELVEVPELGGEIVVRPLMLSDRLALFEEFRSNPERAPFTHIVSLLALSVVDGNGERLYTTEGWERFGGKHMDAALKLFDIAWRVSGLASEEAAKKSEAQTSGSP
jgi:hypothetical protein